MSWLVRSIANTLTLDDEDDSASSPNPNPKGNENNHPKPAKEHEGDLSSPTSPSRGVKEDISELTKTVTRQFWGVASFLAPPPQVEPYKPVRESDHNNPAGKSKFDSSSDPEGSDQKIAGFRSDFAEIGGRFRSGISKLSSNANVSEFTKMAYNFLQLGPDNEDSEDLGEGNDSVTGTVGVTEDVVAFARDISMHPETWLDFPLPGNDDEDDFDLSDVQQEHALAVERLAPRLAALRIELCPGYMSEGCFWMIYFVLLHPRLSKHDAKLLSTPQIVNARAFLSQELKNRTKFQDLSGECAAASKNSNTIEHDAPLSVPSKTEFENVSLTSVESATSEMEKYPVTSTEVPIVDKSVIEEKTIALAKDGNVHSDSSKLFVGKDEDDADDWLKEESSEYGGASRATITIENDEDVSFSDLEEDDGDAPATKKISYSSDKDTRDWVQLSKSSADLSKKVSPHHPETKETNDWLDVDDIDVA